MTIRNQTCKRGMIVERKDGTVKSIGEDEGGIGCGNGVASYLKLCELFLSIFNHHK